MNLPRVLLLTDRIASSAAGRTIGDTVRLAVDGGIRAVVLREKDLPFEQRKSLGDDLAKTLHEVDGTLIIAGDVKLATALKTPWVHLATSDRIPMTGFLHGRSCHDASDVLKAHDLGARYVTVSPTFPSISKPGYAPKSLDRSLELLATSAGYLPTFALGGIRAANAGVCVANGAYGVAAMGAVMISDNPTNAAHEIVTEVENGRVQLSNSTGLSPY